jgi:hypothetical protein
MKTKIVSKKKKKLTAKLNEHLTLEHVRVGIIGTLKNILSKGKILNFV